VLQYIYTRYSFHVGVFKYGLDFYKHIQMFPSEHKCNVILECLCFPEKFCKFKDSNFK